MNGSMAIFIVRLLAVGAACDGLSGTGADPGGGIGAGRPRRDEPAQAGGLTGGGWPSWVSM